MELTKKVKCIFVFTVSLITVSLYLVLTNNYQPIFQLIRIRLVAVKQPEISIENRTITNKTPSDVIFTPRLSAWYPHLPIHIFTQNLSRLSNTSKLILIANGFFGDRNWGIPIGSGSPSQMSK